MSDVPQHAEADLDAIFDIDAQAGGTDQPVISVERTPHEEHLELELEIDVEGRPDVERIFTAGPVGEGAVEGAYVEPTVAAEINDADAKGITRPSRKGSSQRFLTDVIV